MSSDGTKDFSAGRTRHPGPGAVTDLTEPGAGRLSAVRVPPRLRIDTSLQGALDAPVRAAREPGRIPRTAYTRNIAAEVLAQQAQDLGLEWEDVSGEGDGNGDGGSDGGGDGDLTRAPAGGTLGSVQTRKKSKPKALDIFFFKPR